MALDTNTSEIRLRRSGALKELQISKKQGTEEKGGGGMAEEEEEPLSPMARLFHQPHTNCYIIAIMGSGKKIDIELCKAGLESTLIRHPRFSSIQVLDDGRVERWVRTRVVLDDHIVIPDVDPDIPDSDKFVEDYVSGLSRTSIEQSKPLWDFHILNVRTTEAESVAVLRVHHSLGDGISLITLLLACTRKCSDLGSLPSVSKPPKKRTPDHRTGLLLPFLARIWTLLKLVRNTLVDLVMFIATYLFLKDTRTPVKGVEGVELHPKRFVHRTLNLDHFKLVKNATNATMNDVMLGVTSAGLSKYLARRYGIDGPSGYQSLPKNIRLRAALVFSIRPVPGIQDMADTMEKGNRTTQWGNWVGYVLLPFPMVLHEDPLVYVRNAKQIADRKKLSYEALLAFSASAFLVKILGLKAAAALLHRILSNVTMIFSNVVGPAEEISFLGHPIVYIAPSVYGLPSALTVHFQSYMNKVKMVLAVDEETIPDPHQLSQDLADALSLIKRAVAEEL